MKNPFRFLARFGDGAALGRPNANDASKAGATHRKLVFAEERALVYVPENGSAPHPILCFLHGAGEAAHDKEGRPQSLDKMLDHGSPPFHAERGSPFTMPFLVVAPQLERRRRWERSDAASVDALVRRVAEAHRGDVSRAALTGFSLGGEGVFQIASATTLRWTALWAVDPALQRVPPSPRPEQRAWVHYGTEQPGHHNMEAFERALELTAGASETGLPRGVTRLAAGHTETCRAAYAASDMYAWLFR